MSPSPAIDMGITTGAANRLRWQRATSRRLASRYWSLRIREVTIRTHDFRVVLWIERDGSQALGTRAVAVLGELRNGGPRVRVALGLQACGTNASASAAAAVAYRRFEASTPDANDASDASNAVDAPKDSGNQNDAATDADGASEQ